MKRFIKLMSVILVLGVVVIASDLGGNPEVSAKKNNPTTVLGQCDPLERFLGLCRSSQSLTKEN